VIDAIRTAWGWTGIDPEVVLRANAFGNLILRDREGRIWRITPEELDCSIVAATEEQFETLAREPKFTTDWDMQRLVDIAEAKLGRQGSDRCFYFVLPPVIGGAYAADNMATLTREELVRLSGDLARQVDRLPDGTVVKLRVRPQG